MTRLLYKESDLAVLREVFPKVTWKHESGRQYHGTASKTHVKLEFFILPYARTWRAAFSDGPSLQHAYSNARKNESLVWFAERVRQHIADHANSLLDAIERE